MKHNKSNNKQSTCKFPVQKGFINKGKSRPLDGKGKFFKKPVKDDNSAKNCFQKPENKESKEFFKKPVEDSTSKKPFNKKLYRLKKYSNKYKLQQWESQRKRKVEKEYYKQIKDEPKIDVQKIYEQEDSENEANNENNLNEDICQNSVPETSPKQNLKDTKKKGFKKAQEQFKILNEEKALRKEQIEKQKAEKKAALEAYKKKKTEKYKKLNQRTKKGQPVMKGRMELLLEEIEESLGRK